jgi:CBS domain-containing protein
MQIKDILRKPAVTVPRTATMAEVAKAMLDNDVGCVVVVGPRGTAQGVLTVRDFVPHDPGNPFKPDLAHRVFGKSILQHGMQALYAEARVIDAGRMMRPLDLTLEEGDPVERAMDLMLRHDVTHLPVLQGHKAIGSVSRHDLLKVVVAVSGKPAVVAV